MTTQVKRCGLSLRCPTLFVQSISLAPTGRAAAITLEINKYNPSKKTFSTLQKAAATRCESPPMDVVVKAEDDTRAYLLRVGHIHSAKLFAHSTHLFRAQRPLDAFVALNTARDLCRIECESPGDGKAHGMEAIAVRQDIIHQVPSTT